MNKKNIVLIGMPGAGKSTVGVLLAKALGKAFIDTDLIIQHNSGRLLQEIINQEGIERFLEIEEKTILQLDAEDTVIATGGSVVYSRPVMESLGKSGLIVYIRATFEEIEKRISNMACRGIVMPPGFSLYDIFRERSPLYEKFSDIILDCTGKQIEETVSEIARKVREYGI